MTAIRDFDPSDLATFATIDRAWFFAERNLIVDWRETRST